MAQPKDSIQQTSRQQPLAGASLADLLSCTVRKVRPLVATGLLVLTGCATTPYLDQPIPPLAGFPEVQVNELDLDEISPSMETFLREAIIRNRGQDKRAWSLVWATGDRNVFEFDYDPMLTLTPAETFDRRTGNCLAFSGMLVSMARSVGLEAYYQAVEVPPQWSHTTNALLVSKHVNAVVKGDWGEWVVDVSGESSTRYRRVWRISDAEALAQYYNNLGADALTADNLPLAHAYFSKALKTEPSLSFVWSNLGVVLSRNEQTEDARQVYLTAMEIDPQQSIAANNLFLIYEKQGEIELANQLKAQVERHRRDNPYYLYFLSSTAIEEGRYEESTRMLKQAIRMDEKEYRFHYELARSLALQGDLEGAQQSLQTATSLAPNETWIADASVDSLPAIPD